MISIGVESYLSPMRAGMDKKIVCVLHEFNSILEVPADLIDSILWAEFEGADLLRIMALFEMKLHVTAGYVKHRFYGHHAKEITFAYRASASSEVSPPRGVQGFHP